MPALLQFTANASFTRLRWNMHGKRCERKEYEKMHKKVQMKLLHLVAECRRAPKHSHTAQCCNLISFLLTCTKFHNNNFQVSSDSSVLFPFTNSHRGGIATWLHATRRHRFQREVRNEKNGTQNMGEKLLASEWMRRITRRYERNRIVPKDKWRLKSAVE